MDPDPDPGGPKTYGSGYATLIVSIGSTLLLERGGWGGSVWYKCRAWGVNMLGELEPVWRSRKYFFHLRPRLRTDTLKITFYDLSTISTFFMDGFIFMLKGLNFKQFSKAFSAAVIFFYFPLIVGWDFSFSSSHSLFGNLCVCLSAVCLASCAILR